MNENPIMIRPEHQRPVDINISFTVNKKKNNPVASVHKDKNMNYNINLSHKKSINNQKNSKIVDQSLTDRNNFKIQTFKQTQMIKKRKDKKRNVSEDGYNNYSSKQSQKDKPNRTRKKSDLSNINKKSHQKQKSQLTKTKQMNYKASEDLWKMGSKKSKIEKPFIKSKDFALSTQKKSNHSLRYKVNRMINDPSGSSLSYFTNKTKTIIQQRKSIKKKRNKNNKDSQEQNNIDAITKQKIREKLESLQSIDISVFMGDANESRKTNEKRITINTDLSLECITEIQEYEMRRKFNILTSFENGKQQKNNGEQTKNIIQDFITMLKEQEEEREIDDSQKGSENVQADDEQSEEKSVRVEQKQQDRRQFHHFASSQMTKQQSLINQLQRIKLDELKKHEIQKWGQLLKYIKFNLNKGMISTEQILQNVYYFLQESKNDLNNEIHPKCTIKQDEPKIIEIQDFPSQNNDEVQSVSSLSLKNQNTEEDQMLRLMNLSTIENALKQRYHNLLQKQEKQINSLEQKRDSGKITEIDFIIEREKVEIWIKNQINEITKVRKNIWKGYNEAKGILEKTAKTKYFQEMQNSGKKKTMMKCLSENYLLKANYKNVFAQKQRQQISDSSESDDDGSQSLNKDRDIEEIKQKLSKMKEGSHQKQDIYYIEVHKELQQSEESQQIFSRVKQEQKRHLSPQQTKIKQKISELTKDLEEADREDVFQFIFLDLCIELYQEPCYNNRFMNTINNYIKAFKDQNKKKKGVRTNLNMVKEYIKRLFTFLLNANKDRLKNIDLPLGPTALQMLKYMHENDDESPEEQQNQSTLIIPISIFEQFEKILLPSLQFQKYFQDQQRQGKRVQFLKNIIHIHNKAIFDSLNQYLDQLRPFGIWGKPFPWKRSTNFQHQSNEFQKEEKLRKASEKVIEYCSYVCGILVDKEDSLVGNARLSNEYIEQIKQDRLSKMLANQIIDNEERWLFYDDEETEVLVDVSNTLFGILIKEATFEINRISK